VTTLTERLGNTGRSVRPSPNFLALVLGTAVFGWASWAGHGDESAMVFCFVLFGWVTSVAVHEFAHAFAADLGGDHSVRDKGYLDLDPVRYLDPVVSIVVPVVFLLLGGIGLPGAAVWIDRAHLRSRVWESAVSLAGPSANAVLAVVLLAPIGLGWVDPGDHLTFAAGLALLGWLQVIAVTLNLLPIPGLDGFGAIAPFLRPETRIRVQRAGRFAFLWFIVIVISVPSVGRAFFGVSDSVADALGAPAWLVDLGFERFRFWDR
jgi:Zn-dependent protease